MFLVLDYVSFGYSGHNGLYTESFLQGLPDFPNQIGKLRILEFFQSFSKYLNSSKYPHLFLVVTFFYIFALL